MNEFLIAAASAFWLGILTSISPCPLATNIAAISYIGGRAGDTRRVIFAGLLYTLGRMLVYLGLALLLVNTMLSIPQVSLFLQRQMHLFLGPLLIVVAMFLLGLIEVNFGGQGVSQRMKSRVDSLGVAGAFLLGVLFALTFCPTSAALFFGNVMASLAAGSPVVLPMLYGVGTALPVLLFAIVIVLGSEKLSKAFGAVSRLEWWARNVSGAAMLLVGVYLTVRHVFLN